ncbi:MAG: hypothetical protein HQ495_05795 [Alphaproteobacteria bacterium]|nr:hypothetical protein [Alphaproteobacteria bacterium]
MYIDVHSIILFVHVLLFGYWLGADLGVFFCDSQLTRDDLDIEERLRVRRIRYKVDMAPRTCLVLILALGFTLSLRFNSPFDGVWLAVIWIACLSWLALIWMARFGRNPARGQQLGRIDRTVWFLVGSAMIGFGLYTLTRGAPIPDRWLGFKILLFGVITWNGIWIMRVGDRWYPLFDQIRAGGEGSIQAEALMKTNRKRAAAAAGTLWVLVLVMAFMGTTKPF